jgi:hypothetical protein
LEALSQRQGLGTGKVGNLEGIKKRSGSTRRLRYMYPREQIWSVTHLQFLCVDVLSTQSQYSAPLQLGMLAPEDYADFGTRQLG